MSPALVGGFFTIWETLKDHRSTQMIASVTATMQGWKTAIRIHTPRILEDTASYCFWNQPLTVLATLAWAPVTVRGLLPLTELREPFNLGDHERCWEWQVREKQGSPTVQTPASTYSPFTIESKLSWRSSHYHRHSLSVAIRVKTQRKKNCHCCFTGSHPVIKQWAAQKVVWLPQSPFFLPSPPSLNLCASYSLIYIEGTQTYPFPYQGDSLAQLLMAGETEMETLSASSVHLIFFWWYSVHVLSLHSSKISSHMPSNKGEDWI